MTEADEIATTLRPMFVAVIKPQNRDMAHARRFVREWAPELGATQTDNVAESLIRKDKEAEQTRRDKHATQERGTA